MVTIRLSDDFNGNIATRTFNLQDAARYLADLNESDVKPSNYIAVSGDLVIDYGIYCASIQGATLEELRKAYRPRKRETCYRCEGAGIIDVYKHVRGGICFKCWGAGIIVK